MSKINRQDLESSYMSPAKVLFYTTDLNPNGTASLIITDQDGQVIDVLDELLFNPVLDHERNGATFGGVSICPYGDSVWLYDKETQDERVVEDIVYPLLIADVLNSIAESPVHNRLGQLKRLVASIKGGL